MASNGSSPAAGSPPVSALTADLTLAAITLIWGVTFPVVKSALAYASPLRFNATRMSCAALLLALFYGGSLRKLRVPVVLAGAALGLCLAGGYAFQTAGLAITAASTSAFITGLSVVLVPFLIAVGWRRRIEVSVWVGAGLALAGLYLLVFAGSAGSGVVSSHRGEWLTLGCSLCFALHIVALGEFAPRFPFRQLAVLQIAFCALFTWLALPAVEASRWHSTPALWSAVLLTAVFATAVAFTGQTWAQQFTPASHTAVVFALEPVFAWAASTLGWRERLHWVQLAGALLIVAGILAVEAKTIWKTKRPPLAAG